MPYVQRHPDLRIALEAANAGAMARAGVDDDDRAGAGPLAALRSLSAAAGDAKQRASFSVP